MASPIARVRRRLQFSVGTSRSSVFGGQSCPRSLKGGGNWAMVVTVGAYQIG